jgi:hypothetical protein
MKRRTSETCVIWDDRDEPRSITPHDKGGQGIAWI